ncbi:MAG TPA: F0F1 ATP synthase subunit A [Acidimicrobiales bacterium]|nr:F0F1 ATP synthase subunit A [Acidimicrobiales bacterium]
MVYQLAALEFPPVSHLIEWPDFLFEGTPFAFNKIALLTILSALFTLAIFTMGGRTGQLVPPGIQNVAESIVDFVRDGIVMQTMGPSGLSWVPFLTTVFMFIFFCNLFEVIPGIQMPASARMAIPGLLALTVWVLYNYQGIKHQGFGGYLKNTLIPPGVPKALLPLVMLIEFVSTFFVRPFSLAVRLFANMLAGHLLLVTFGVLSAALFTKAAVAVILPLPFLMLILLTGFEIFVAGLQAFIFTILTAVYLGGAIHPDH